MQLAIEISLYPLDEKYIQFIQDFIDRLNNDQKLLVETSHTSTLISGDYDHVIDVLKTEMKLTYEQVGQAIFVCKFLNATHMNLRN